MHTTDFRLDVGLDCCRQEITQLSVFPVDAAKNVINSKGRIATVLADQEKKDSDDDDFSQHAG